VFSGTLGDSDFGAAAASVSPALGGSLPLSVFRNRENSPFPFLVGFVPLGDRIPALLTGFGWELSLAVCDRFALFPSESDDFAP
jgi:hypothetical protein